MRENKTTIENLENKSRPYLSKYDISWDYNITQIMGTKKWLWPFPIMTSSAKPKGEGIYFDKNAESEASDAGEGDEDNDTSQEDNQQDQNGADQRPNYNQTHGTGNGNTANPPQNRAQHSNSQIARPGEGQPTNDNNTQVTKQGDKMTIHDGSRAKWDNLNNIVKAENPVQTYKSGGSEGVVGVKPQDRQQFVNATTEAQQDSKQADQNPSRRSGRPGERIDSKSSTGQLMRRTQDQNSAGVGSTASRKSNYGSPGLASKSKPKKGTAGGRGSTYKKVSPTGRLKPGRS